MDQRLWLYDKRRERDHEISLVNSILYGLLKDRRSEEAKGVFKAEGKVHLRGLFIEAWEFCDFSCVRLEKPRWSMTIIKVDDIQSVSVYVSFD